MEKIKEYFNNIMFPNGIAEKPFEKINKKQLLIVKKSYNEYKKGRKLFCECKKSTFKIDDGSNLLCKKCGNLYI